MKILFCDDEISIGGIAKHIFLNTDHDFLYTETLDQSRRAIASAAFDIIIIDLHWKGQEETGFDLVKFIHGQMRGEWKPKIYITSGFLDIYRERISEISHLIDGTYKKPEELLALLQDLAK